MSLSISAIMYDRDLVSSNKMDGGGVLVALIRTLRSSECDIYITLANSLYCNLVEHVLIELPSVRPPKRNIISAAFIPPKTATPVYEQHLAHLQQILGNSGVDCFYIVGDYNLSEITWNIPTLSASLIGGGLGIGSSTTCCLLNNFMSIHDALQYNVQIPLVKFLTFLYLTTHVTYRAPLCLFFQLIPITHFFFVI